MFVVQADERNMYDQHWHSASLKEIYPFCLTTSFILEEVKLTQRGSFYQMEHLLWVAKQLQLCYTPNDYPTESEWRARLLMDLSYSNRSYLMWRQWVMGNPLPIAHPYLLYKWRHNTGTSSKI
ncbi:unnamed protein product [Prunus brigantina]